MGKIKAMRAKAGYATMTQEEKDAFDADAKKKMAAFKKNRANYEDKDMYQRKMAEYSNMTGDEKMAFDEF